MIENSVSYGQCELLWWRYRSVSRALLRTHHDTAAFAQINRALIEELDGIRRREQDFVLDVSEKLFAAGDVSRRDVDLEPEAVDEAYRAAIAGMRELSQAVADAHVRSIEALWRQSGKRSTVA